MHPILQKQKGLRRCIRPERNDEALSTGFFLIEIEFPTGLLASGSFRSPRLPGGFVSPRSDLLRQ